MAASVETSKNLKTIFNNFSSNSPFKLYLYSCSVCDLFIMKMFFKLFILHAFRSCR